MSWSELVAEALGASGGPPVERLRVRPGEALARVGEHEVSLIRTVWPDTEWSRVCAALASQPMFRARVLAGELPEETERVFALLGLDLVPEGWGGLVATCSCDRWSGRCHHLSAVVRALGEEADRDPFVLTRWAGLEKRSVIELVEGIAAGTKSPRSPTVRAGTKTIPRFPTKGKMFPRMFSPREHERRPRFHRTPFGTLSPHPLPRHFPRAREIASRPQPQGMSPTSCQVSPLLPGPFPGRSERRENPIDFLS
nr:hypothetical protein [Nocardiopsis alba]